MNLFSNLALYFRHRKEIDGAAKVIADIREGALKPGMYTTEFWSKNLIQVLAIAGIAAKASGQDWGVDPQSGAVIVAGLEALYAVVRTVLKIAHSLSTPAPTVTVSTSSSSGTATLTQ